MKKPVNRPIIPLGTQTTIGIVVAVGFVGERYYWLKEKQGTISMMPDSARKSPPVRRA